jgi:hypothetical protein
MCVFYLGQLGKCVPDTVWPAVTQMRLGRDYRVPPRASGAAFAVFMLVLVGTGLLVGLPVVPLLSGEVVDEYRWLALALPLFVLALAPPVLNRAVAPALRALGRPPLPAPLSLAGGAAGRRLGASLLALLRRACVPAGQQAGGRGRGAAVAAVHRRVPGRLRQRPAAAGRARRGRGARGRPAAAPRRDRHGAGGRP